ncbi:hypothetical protein BU24DRAFT_473646 [Aaosphaeria arxii CBS 175.79]|uniref:Uncharacterized protein n=1 Tax=Aaosphaeria arxii CBS 175.79 TaxID=1450172 RepID=A0A6A5X8U3_9PLEO|nr:uncharacterized protein BU24DRAFT_473646 [Aaosphaeria arxii CBS 175.79]KAF2009485.1 hypothetical protein BU24DRAFT_473646 [Aaosphaeria arxii CBS 175.79]
MPVYLWRRFRSRHSACLIGSEKSVNYTSHHLRCEQINSSTKQQLCQQTSQQVGISRSWPGTAQIVASDEEDSFSNVFSRIPELQYTDARSSGPQQANCSTSSSQPPANLHISSVKPPPLCRLSRTPHLSIFLLYLTVTLSLLSTLAEASPLLGLPSDLHLNLHRRQAIPDKFGRTGNEPAPVASQPPPQPATPTISILPSTTTASTFNSATPQPSFPATGTDDNDNTRPQNEFGIPPQSLTLISSPLRLSPGVIAGIAGGGAAVLFASIGIAVCVYRRRRRIEVNEIPIRRSRLGSRLAHRFFGDMPSRGPSRNVSRNGFRRGSDESDARSEKQLEAGWVDKGSISRPKNAWLENGLLSVPKPKFMREEKDDDVAPWVIGVPRPARPISAEPLGRLSGMGMGMGYLK